MNKNNQMGRSMVEMLGVLAIIGVLSVGGIAGYSKAMEKFKIGKLLDQLVMIITNIRTLYSGQPNYEGLNNVVAIQSGAIPTEMLNGKSSTVATEIYHALNGEVAIEDYSSSDGIRGAHFSIVFHKLPVNACVALASVDFGDANSGLEEVVIGGVGDTIFLANELPVSVAKATAGCLEQYDGSGLYVYLSFK